MPSQFDKLRLSSLRPTLAIVLGSGFHHVLTGLHVDNFPNAETPGFPVPGVSGSEQGPIVAPGKHWQPRAG
jgi:purine nucleoside phosphorylase